MLFFTFLTVTNWPAGLSCVAGGACACCHYSLLLLRTNSPIPKQLEC
jgi:hypothetical protein